LKAEGQAGFSSNDRPNPLDILLCFSQAKYRRLKSASDKKVLVVVILTGMPRCGFRTAQRAVPAIIKMYQCPIPARFPIS